MKGSSEVLVETYFLIRVWTSSTVSKTHDSRACFRCEGARFDDQFIRDPASYAIHFSPKSPRVFIT